MKFRKFLTGTLATAILATNFAFAAPIADLNPYAPYATETQRIYDLGIIKGKANGEIAAEAYLNRAELYQILLTLKGIDIEEYADQDGGFTDTTGWNAKVAAAAKANGMTNGVSATEFAPNKTVEHVQAVAAILKTLGYADEITGIWGQDVLNVAASKGLRLTAEAVAPAGAVKRGSVFQLVSQALDIEQADGTKLADKFEEDKEEAKIPTKVEITKKSIQGVVGKTVTLEAKTDVPGAKITFAISGPVGTLNTAIQKDVIADKDGVATYTYTRSQADADTVQVYANDAQNVRDISKVYWGVKPILTIKADKTATINGGTATYTATLTNPVTGELMKDRTLRVMFKENIGKEGTRVTAVSMFDQSTLRPYQDVNNNFASLEIRTDYNGEAKFTVSGNHDSVTPIVFYDNRTFFGEGLYDSTQYLASFAGDNDSKLDPMELQVEGETVAFGKAKYEITAEVSGDTYRGTDFQYTSGRKYTVTVKRVNDDGTTAVFAGGTVNVGLEELLGSTYKDTRARFVEINKKERKVNGVKKEPAFDLDVPADDNYKGTVEIKERVDGQVTVAQVKLDKDGKFTFVIASDRENTEATPVVWVDQDTPDQYSGKTNGRLDSIDFVQALTKTVFVKKELTGATLYAAKEAGSDDKKDGSYGADKPAIFTYKFLDNNGDKKGIGTHNVARVTYTIYNSGSKDLTVDLPLSNITIDQVEKRSEDRVFTIKPGQTRTVSGTTAKDVDRAELFVRSVDNETGGAARVTARAEVINKQEGSQDYNKVIRYTSVADAATATWTKSDLKEAVLVTNSTYVGKSLDTDSVKDDKIKLGLINDRYVYIDYTTADEFYAGKVTTISSTDKLTQNDFSQATRLTDDADGKMTAFKKFEAALKEGAAVMVEYKKDGKSISKFIVLYTDSMYDEGRDGVGVKTPTVKTDAEKITEAANALTLPTTPVTANLTLPTSNANGATIAWTSSNAAVVSTTGVVTRPAAGAADATVTLTATVTSGTATAATKTFTVVVKAQEVTAVEWLSAPQGAAGRVTAKVDTTKVDKVVIKVENAADVVVTTFDADGTFIANVGTMKLATVIAYKNNVEVKKATDVFSGL